MGYFESLDPEEKLVFVCMLYPHRRELLSKLRKFGLDEYQLNDSDIQEMADFSRELDSVLESLEL